ncbi:MAG: hypothetical protein ACM3MI_12605 [Clostridiales bacterium]
MLSFEGDFTINSISNIKSGIQKHLDLNSTVEMEISDITEMDITFLQVLLSLEDASSKISVRMTPGSKEKIREFMKSYGYHKELNMLKMEN